MELWLETTLKGLYDSALDAFPSTTRRQNSTHSVIVEHMDWVPFRGVKTLFLKSLVRNEGRKNEAIVLFKGVRYADAAQRGFVPIKASDGRAVYLERLSWDKTDALVRCSCADFRWRFSHWNRVDKSLFGRPARKYEARERPGSSNPDESPGICKHLMKMAKILAESGVLKLESGQIDGLGH